jgi:hypothetical protein
MPWANDEECEGKNLRRNEASGGELRGLESRNKLIFGWMTGDDGKV